MSMGGYNSRMTIIRNCAKIRHYGRTIYSAGMNPHTTKAQRLAEINAINASETISNVEKQVLTTIREPVSVDERRAARTPKPRRLTLSEREGFKDLMDMNFTTGHQYITLTYVKEDVTLDEAGRDFENWIKRMRERYGDFKYLGVRSFQRRSTPHFHLLADLPRIPVRELKDGTFQRIWGHGIVHVKRIYNAPMGTGRNKLQQYLLKNLAEFKADKRSYGKRLYLRSRNLIEPEVVKGDYETLKADLVASGHTLKLLVSRRFDVEYLNYIELETYRV
ncbi:Rep protein [Paenibacillus vulneris]|uniref:RNA replicase n=1 Tax=Paenibacillus vulneris TaxID=1133364 RepID=A0ABW3UP29_9BACL